MAASAGDHSVTLTWTDPSDSNITRYEYRVNHTDTGTGNLSGWSSWKNIPSSDSSTTTYAFTGLTNGKEYRYKIRAVVEIGEGNDAPSKPGPGVPPYYLSATPQGAEPPPVSKFWVERVCDHHFRVRWHRVSGATGYDLNLSGNHRKSWVRKMTNKNYNAWQFSQWSKDKTYWFAIRAVNAHGASVWKDVQSVALPCPVEGLKASYLANGDVSVSWNAAKRASGYDVNFSSDAGKSWERMGSNVSATTYSFNKDTNALPYNPNFLVAVQSRKGGLTSGWRNAPIVRIIPGSRDSSKDFSLDASNDYPFGIWSNRVTMWVADNDDDKLYAYQMSDQSRDSSKDISLAYYEPSGIWSNGVTMWVADIGETELFAYSLTGKTRDSGKDIRLANANSEPGGIWSDGKTMWAVDTNDAKVYAYKMSDGSYDSAKDYTTLDTSNDRPFGIWSDGVTTWVVDNSDEKLYAYHSIDPN